MTHVITRLCLRDAACVEVCPVECIVPGKPVDEWPLFYIDPDTCIDCGACVPECPFEAIFPEDEVPAPYVAKGGERISLPASECEGGEPYTHTNHSGEEESIPCTVVLEAGQEVDLTPDIEANARYFSEGTGYAALEE